MGEGKRFPFRVGFWFGVTFAAVAGTAGWLKVNGHLVLSILVGLVAVVLGFMPVLSAWADQDDERNT